MAGQQDRLTANWIEHRSASWQATERSLASLEDRKPVSAEQALNAIREAFGPLKLDALGYCGKWGQSVPSSGGSHYFLVLDPHPDVRLGGG